MGNNPRPRGAGLRILLGADTYPPDINGAANFADRLARGLARRGHDVHVICPEPSIPASTDTDGAITVHRVPSLPTPFHPTLRICTTWRASRAIRPIAPTRVPRQATPRRARSGCATTLLQSFSSRTQNIKFE